MIFKTPHLTALLIIGLSTFISFLFAYTLKVKWQKGSTLNKGCSLFLRGALAFLLATIIHYLVNPNSELDIQLHDVYLVISRTHLSFLLVIIFNLIAGVYFLLDWILDQPISNLFARIHFWLSFIGCSLIFFTVNYMSLSVTDNFSNYYINGPYSLLARPILIILVILQIVFCIMVIISLCKAMFRKNKG